MPAWNKISIPKSTLEESYIRDGLSIKQTADRLNLSTGPVHRLLREYKIPTRTISEAKTKVKISKKELRKLYFKNKLSMLEIANKLGCTRGAIVYKFKKFGLTSRGHLGLTKPIKINKETMEKLYDKGLSLAKIAKISHFSEGGIERRFNSYKITPRGNRNRAPKYKKKDFSNDPIEKAYMIGFRLGDLAASKRVSIIFIRCSSTHRAQIKLIRDLFSRYTTPHSWLAKRGTMEITCMLNRSFDFLLSKKDEIPPWVVRNKEVFFSFFAGYTDAEGCFHLKKPKKTGKTRSAVLEIQTQQKNIIMGLWFGLKKFGIYAQKPIISELAGHIDSHGVRNNKSMWRLTVSRKRPLWVLLNYLESYIKHREKVLALQKLKENIVMRNSIPYARPIDLALPSSF